jgi:hypothetical protein
MRYNVKTICNCYVETIIEASSREEAIEKSKKYIKNNTEDALKSDGFEPINNRAWAEELEP